MAMADFGRTSGYMSPEAEKDLYEALDTLNNVGADHMHADEFAMVLMTITGTTLPTDGYPAHHPGIQNDARRVVHRWLRDNGHLPQRR